MQDFKIVVVAGARPNFMKVAPILRCADKEFGQRRVLLFHTGQHFDSNMNEIFFQELGIRQPDFVLPGRSIGFAQQFNRIMTGFERFCSEQKPNLVIVVGDVDSTLACALVAKKLGIMVAHVEAGLRSGDLNMPEEINRICTDAITDLYFASEPSGVKNLLSEGYEESKIFNVGNVMIDNLYYQLSTLKDSNSAESTVQKFKEKKTDYAVLTLHRPSNVDEKVKLKKIIRGLNEVAEILPIYFPAHPRTKENLSKFGLTLSKKIFMSPPLPYREFLDLWKDSKVVLTDSGGLQEETTALGVKCLTLRESTERPLTIEFGTNELIGQDMCLMKERILRLVGERRQADPLNKMLYWDGKSSTRIIHLIKKHMNW